MKKVWASVIVLAVCLVGLSALPGCQPKAVGVDGGEPVGRVDFDQQAAGRRADLAAERAAVVAKLDAARLRGDPDALAAAQIDAIDHQAATVRYNELYRYGVSEFDRQAANNAETFAVLETVGQAGAASVGLPPGVWQALAGLVAGLAGRAGWMKLRKVKTELVKAANDTSKSAGPGVT